MWMKQAKVIHEPHCKIVDDELRLLIPVCRDELREMHKRIQKWRQEGFEFERVEVEEEEECSICR